MLTALNTALATARRPLLWGLTLLLLAGVGHGAPPNVVLIVADDLGWADLGCYGSDFYETPALDALAEQGVRFTDAYAAAPVCSPSRAALMTGKNPARLGLTAHIGDVQPDHWRRDTPLRPARYVDRLEHEEQTLAERLHNEGYATLHAGKWHLGHEPFYPEYQGFDVNYGGWSQGGPFTGSGYFSPHGNPRLRDGPEGEYLTDRLAEDTVRFIQAHRHEPFFVHLAFYQVHVPLQARADLLAKYEAKLKALPPLDDRMIDGPDSRLRARQDLPVYAAMVEALDQAVGRVLAGVEKAGVADNTIVVFTSDNGGLSTGDLGISPAEGWPTTNAPLRAGKGWLYEGGIRVPLIVRSPGIGKAGAVSHRVVTGADCFATVEGLVGLDRSASAQDSRSFTSALRGEAAQREPAYWHFPHYGNQGGRPGGAVRDQEWKLIEWYGTHQDDSEIELFNLATDPGETTNLAAIETTRRDAMLADLRDWRRGLRVEMPTPHEPAIAQPNQPARAARVSQEPTASR